MGGRYEYDGRKKIVVYQTWGIAVASTVAVMGTLSAIHN